MPSKGPVITVIDFHLMSLIQIKPKALIEEISEVLKKEFTHKQVWMNVKKLINNQFVSVMKNGKHSLTAKGKGELAKISKRSALIALQVEPDEELPEAA